MSKGNYRQNIFLDDQDRSRFLESAGEMSERYEILLIISEKIFTTLQ